MNKLAILAMTEKGFEVVRAVYEAAPSLVECVVSARDRFVSDDFFDTIREYCDENSIPFHSRHPPEFCAANYAFAVSWRWMINSFPGKVIVFHDSLLPKYRGFNPLVTALIQGDAQVGVTALYASKNYDCGPIIGQRRLDVTYPVKIQHAIEIAAQASRDLAVQLARDLEAGRTPHGVEQDESAATYSLWRDEDDYWIDWRGDASSIRRKIDAVGRPYAGAATLLGGRTVRILEAEEADDVVIANRDPGKVIFVEDGAPVVVCGEGLLRIRRIQDEEGATLLPLRRFRSRFRAPTA